MDRKRFLQSLLGASAFAAVPYSSYGKGGPSIDEMLDRISVKTSGSLAGFKVEPINTVRIGIIGLGNRGTTLIDMFQWLVEKDRAEIVALSDLDEKKVNLAKEKIGLWQKATPRTYFKNDEDWKNLAKQDNICHR